jgi:hypothetical protein
MCGHSQMLLQLLYQDINRVQSGYDIGLRRHLSSFYFNSVSPINIIHFFKAIIWFLFLSLLGTVTNLTGTPKPTVQSSRAYLGKRPMNCITERYSHENIIGRNYAHLNGSMHYSPVTPNTINMNTRSNMSAIQSDNFVRNLLPSFQSGCASPGKHFIWFIFFLSIPSTYLFHVS